MTGGHEALHGHLGYPDAPPHADAAQALSPAAQTPLPAQGIGRVAPHPQVGGRLGHGEQVGQVLELEGLLILALSAPYLHQ